MRIFVLLVSLLCFLTGCQSTHQLYEVSDVPLSGQKDVRKSLVPTTFLGDKRQIKTLDMSGEAFNTVGEWYDNESILYINDHNNGSNIFRYNLFSGERDLFFTTESPVITMKANEDHTLFLLHTSDTYNQVKTMIVDKDGNLVYEWKIESFDLFYNWNPYNNEQVVLTTFSEDWSYDTYLMDVSNKQVTHYEIPQPFVQWLDESHISYLKWDQNEPTFFAPLYSFDMESKTEGLLFENIISFSAYSDLIVTVDLDTSKDSYGFYRFYDTDTRKKVQEISAPLLTDYSKWNIPFEEYVPDRKLFYMFRPYSTGSFDTYSEKYELVSLNLLTGTEERILDAVDSKPILLSPNASYSLYGYQYENIIDLQSKEVIELVTF